MSERQATGENASVVVQCPTCQSKFRIADEKVTDRGVRVRCTSCKNVFQVRKPGAAASEPSAPGTTIDLSSLGAAALARSGVAGTAKPAAPARPGAVKPSTGPVKPSTGPVKPSTGPLKPSTGPVKPSTGPVKPSTGPVKPSTGPLRATGKPSTGPVKPSTGPLRTSAPRSTAAVQTDDGAARRLDVDDLFGMAELTGDSPLSAGLDPPVPPPAPAAKATEAPAANGLDDLELEIETAHKSMPPAVALDAPLPSLDPPLPAATNGAAEPAAPAALNLPLDSPAPRAAASEEERSGAEDLELDEGPASKPAEPAPPPPRAEPARRPITKPQPARPPEPEIAPARAVVSSAFTGLLGAALAVIVVIASAFSDDGTAGWFGFGPASDVIATGVVSGLYDTAGGKPVFYIRGRIQNRSNKVRGPVRVTAELLADGSAEAKAETIAGAEPTPEDVWSVRSSADADKLARNLQSARVKRKLQPGESLPFFAVIADPPADLDRHRLQIRVDTVEAWTPGAAKAAREQ